ncbi:protein prenylyltransferase [Thozetella sp. PMI_491]|nr:protein prenylyltransferase [Thozetella sp. PMI_491]
MSRALDKATAASLAAGDASAAYRDICDALRTSPTSELLEIEILPKGHQLEPGTCLLRDGPAIAVSKVGLVQAFLVARKLLKGHLDGTAPPPEDALADATAVILLMDPEFVTAANIRKRLLLAHASEVSELRSRIDAERRVIDSLLTSRLHRHTKSPTLWGHRRWLLELSLKLGMTVDLPGDMANVVMVSGDRHPRNYYAWLHARFLATLPSTSSDELDRTVLPAVKAWCFRHYTDISGWSFLHYLLDLRGPSYQEAAAVLTETLRLATTLRWANESVWVFLRTLVSSDLVGEPEYVAFLGARQALLETVKEPSQVRVLEAALAWCETYRAGT